jgi:hypothetical protein
MQGFWVSAVVSWYHGRPVDAHSNRVKSRYCYFHFTEAQKSSELPGFKQPIDFKTIQSFSLCA